MGALNSQEIIVLLNDAQESGRMIEDIGMSGDSLQQTPLYSTRIIINKRNAFVASDISSPTASDEAANLFISFLKTNNKGPEGPKLENEDEPYTKKVFKNLRSFGYMINCENVPCVNPQFHVDYHFNFAIPGFGDFYSDACTESSDALKIATSRLKQFYDQQFSSLSQQFANSKLKHHQFTFPVDFKWVGLLNSFSHGNF